MNFHTNAQESLKFLTGEFPTLVEALDYAACGMAAASFYNGKAELTDTLSYASLRGKARALAARMLAAGLKPGDRAGIVAETDADFLIGFFGCQYAGIVPAPLPLPATFGGRGNYIQHLQGMLTIAGAKTVVGSHNLQDMIEEAAEGCGVMLAGTLRIFDGYDADETQLPTVRPDDLSYIQFSSGSTRFPSGVAVTHRSLMANVQAIAQDGLKVREDDHCVSWLPMYHDMGLIGFLLTPLATQMSVDYVPTREFARRPMVWPQLISRNGGTLSFSPSFGYDLCARRAARGRLEELDLSHWRVAGIGGDMIRPDVLERFATELAPAGFNPKAFVASYGMAEATLGISFAPLDTGIETETLHLDRLEANQIAIAVKPGAPQDARSRVFVRCGSVLPGHQLEIRATSSDAKLPDGCVGRIMFRGPSLMREYFGDREATERAMTSGGWLDTGDLGYLRDGVLVVTGRSKDLILVHGRNVWPQDIEWAVEAQVDGLRDGDVAAFSIDDGTKERVVLGVHCRKSDPAQRDALRQAIVEAARLHVGVDCHVELLPPNSLPKTSSGKLSRAGARKLYTQICERRARRIARIRPIKNRSRAGIDDRLALSA